MQDEMKLQDYGRIAWANIWKNKTMIFAVTLLFFFIGMLYVSLRPEEDIYSAKASVYTIAGSSTQETTVTSNALKGYSDILRSKKVCDRAEAIIGDANINANMIKRMISASYNNSSTVMTISAYSTDQNIAVKVANGVARAFVIEIQSIVESDKIKILDEANGAELATRAIDIMIKNVLMLGMAGLFLTIAVIVVNIFFSNKIQSVEQCLDEDEGEILGMLPFIE